MTWRAASLLAAALGVLSLPSSAFAADLTASQFEDLIERARSSPEALERLRDVDTVDGAPVDLEPVLRDASTDEIAARLEAIHLRGGPRPSETARRTAAEILEDRRFNEPDPPRPLKGVIEWLDDRTRAVTDRFERFAESFPGGPLALWVLLASAVLGLAVVVGARLAGRGSPLSQETRVATGERDDPGELERRAADAARAGDLASEIRLRFRAGVVHLARKGVLPRRDSVTTEEISQTLRSQTFDHVAAIFDRVVYGHRTPSEKDAEESREGWRTIRKEVRV